MGDQKRPPSSQTMKDALHEKLADFAKWAHKALKRHAEGDAEDALTNMRKAGEAACKVLLIDSRPVKHAEQLILEAKGPRDLVQAVLKHGSVTREVVIWLESLHTFGNTAAHDDRVDPQNARIGVEALRALSSWLYKERIGVPMPAELGMAWETDAPKAAAASTASSAHLAEELLERMTKEQASFEQRQSKAMDASARSIAQAYQEDIASIRQFLTEERTAREAALKEIAEIPRTAPLVEPRGKVARRSWRGVVLAVLVVGLLVGLAIHFLTGPQLPAGNAVGGFAGIKPKGGLDVLLVPLTIVQDNPQITMRLEEALRAGLESRAAVTHLPIRISIADTLPKNAIPESVACSIAVRMKADLIIYGELYEPTATDSGRVVIRYREITYEQRLRGELEHFKFRTLDDSSSLRMQKAVQALVELDLAYARMQERRWSQALSIIHAIRPVTRNGRFSVAFSLAICHRRSGDLTKAIHYMEACLREYPKSANALAYMAKILADNDDRAAAIGFQERAIAQAPDSVDLIMELADLVSDFRHPETRDEPRVRALAARAMSLDSSRSDVWSLRAQIQLSDGEKSGAIVALERSIELDSNNVTALHTLAEALVAETDTPDIERGEMLLRKVLRLDSTRGHACLLLAELLNGIKKDPELAAYLFRKSEQEDPKWAYASLIGRARTAYNADRWAEALALYQQAWATDKSDLSICHRLAVVYSKLERYEEASAQVQRCYALDTLDHEANVQLGNMYAQTDTIHEVSMQAIRHYERALLTDPEDKRVLDGLSDQYMFAGEVARMRPLVEKLLKQQPDHANGNFKMGFMLQQGSRYAEAIQHYEKAFAREPRDETALANCAVCHLQLGAGHTPVAISLLLRAVQLNPKPSNLYNLSRAYGADHQYQLANEYYLEAIAADPKFRDRRFETILKRQGY